MAVSGKFAADFASFYEATQKAVVSLKGFETGSAKVETSLNKMANSLNGTKLIQDAVLMTKAVEAVGGASTLTATQMASVNKTLTEAIAKYAALGQTAPKAMTDLAAATKAVEAPTEGLSTKMVALGSFIGTMAATAVTALGRLAVQGLKAVASGIAELVMEGPRISGLENSFQTLAGSLNESGAAMLGAMRTGTRGLVSDLDLMAAANKAVLLGLPVTAKEMGDLSQTATVLGRAMRLGPTAAFDNLITALGRSSPLILDNLGLSVKVGEANETYARALGKTAQNLTEAEQKTAFYNATMVAARDKVKALGESQDSLGDSLKRAGVWWENFKNDLSIAIARSPAVAAAMDQIGASFAAAFGTDTTGRVKALTDEVDQFGIRLVDAAQAGIMALGALRQGFAVVEFAIAGTASAITAMGLLFSNVVMGAAELAAKLPGVGGEFTAAARAARDYTTHLHGVQKGFSDYAAEMVSAITGHGQFQASLDRASGTLGTMKTAMVGASGAIGETSTKTAALTEENKKAKVAADALTKTIEAQAGAYRTLISEAKNAAGVAQMDAMAEGMARAAKNAEGLYQRDLDHFTMTQANAATARAQAATDAAAAATEETARLAAMDALNTAVKATTAAAVTGADAATTGFKRWHGEVLKISGALAVVAKDFDMMQAYLNAGIFVSGTDTVGKTAYNARAAQARQRGPGLPPGMASGGPVSGGSPYMVGERGPELFVPRTPGTIVPNGGGGTQTIILKTYLDGREIAQALTRVVM